MVFNHTHSQILLRYKENGGRIEPYRGGSAGRVDATRGSKHRGLEHAGEKRKSEAQSCSLRGDCT
jgi:hypothetical protein